MKSDRIMTFQYPLRKNGNYFRYIHHKHPLQIVVVIETDSDMQFVSFKVIGTINTYLYFIIEIGLLTA